MICVSFIPGVLVFAFQFFTFFGEKSDAGISMEGFRTSKIWTQHPFISAFLVLCFPLLFILLNFKREIKKKDIQLSLIYVSVGWIMSSLLYETGEREKHGNMGWAYMISLYILWMVVLSHFLVDYNSFDMGDKKSKTKNGVLIGLLSFHFLFGLVYIYDLLTKPGFWY